MQITVGEGAFTPTPASRITLKPVVKQSAKLIGVALALLPKVDFVLGADISVEDVECARQNAAANSVAEKTAFVHADGLQACHSSDTPS
eukprot:gene6049-5914_t